MSSSPPTEAAPAPRARWRKPAGWSLRTRLVAAMVSLVGLLGVAIAATTGIALYNGLHQQIDRQLEAAAGRAFGALGGPEDQSGPAHPPPRDIDGGGRRRFLIPPGQVSGTVAARVIDGSVEAQWLDENGRPQALPTDVAAVLGRVPAGAEARTYRLGDLGAYRVVAREVPTNGDILVTGLPLKDTEATLYLVAGVGSGVTILALLATALAGTVIVRRTLQPLSRVAATATRVSELKLDRGAVDLAQRVPEPDTDPRTEVGQVGAALNRMLDHVGNALEARHASETQVRQFVADASHELRTPLAAIRGYAELSRRSRQPVSDEIAHVLNRVESEAKRMTGLVEDLLLLARLDAGRPLAQDPVDLTMLVVDAVSDAHAAGPRHDWQLDLPEEPVTVVGDAARLHQVLANLLANARTHTPEGTTVTVGVGATDDTVVLRVTDEGPGIPAELQPHIFERFARGDSSRSRAAGSTGLGLSIVHAVVAAHHGEVSLRSQPGRTVFTVVLPLVPPGLVPPAEQLAPPVPQSR